MILWLALAHAAPVELRVRSFGSGDPVRTFTVDGVEHTTDRGNLTLDVESSRTLHIGGSGFLETTVEVEIPQSRPVRVWLRPGRPPLEIVVESTGSSPEVSKHAVDAEVMYETPGNREDAVRLVQSLPGVAVQREYSPNAGTLIVRGSAPQDSRYYLDGIEIPYLYHYNQYASVFPASQLSQLELHSSTFGSRYGNSVGAIVEATSDRARPDAVHGSAFLNFVVVGGQLSTPLFPKRKSKWWASVSARRSYQDLVSQQSNQFVLWPVFGDYAVRLENGDENGGTGVFFWGASDRYARAAAEVDLLDPVEADTTTTLDYRRNFQVFGARHHWTGSDDWGRAVVAVIRDRIDGTLEEDGSQTSSSWSLNSRFDASHRFKPNLGWDLGYELRLEQLDLKVADPGYQKVLVAQELPALARGVEVDEGQARLRGGIYGTAHFGNRTFQVMPGLRIGFDSLGTVATVDPRLTLRLRASDDTAFRLAGGHYSQRPKTEHLFAGTGDPTLPTTRSWQVAGGIEQTIAGRLSLNAEGYYKQLDHLLVYPVDEVARVGGAGAAFGAELTARYRVRDRFFMHGWAAYSRSFVGLGSERLPSAGDQPLNLGLITSWDPTRHLNLAARYRLGSGLPYTSFEGSTFDASRDDWIPQTGDLNAARYPLYQKVDLRVAWTQTFRRVQVTASLELWYVPKKSTQLYPAFNYDYSESTWVRGPTLFPLGGIRAKW